MNNSNIVTERYTRQNTFLNNNLRIQNEDPVLKKIAKKPSDLRNLLYDAHVSSVVESRKAGTRTLSWRLAESDSCPTKVRAYVNETLLKIDVPQLINHCLDARLYGWTFIELIYNLKNGIWHLIDTPQRNQEWFEFDEYNNILFNGGAYGAKTEKVPELKHLLIQNNASYSNPHGEALLSKVYWSCVFKRDTMNAWLIASEKYGAPLLYGAYPDGWSTTQKETALEDLSNLVKSGTGLAPLSLKVEQIPAMSSGNGDMFRSLVDFCNNEISKALVGATLTSEVGASGSYAVGKVHYQVMQTIIADDVQFVQSAFQRLIDKICFLNFGVTNTPAFVLDGGIVADKSTAQRDFTLAMLGVRFNERHYIDNYGINDKYFHLVNPTFPGAIPPDETKHIQE